MGIDRNRGGSVTRRVAHVADPCQGIEGSCLPEVWESPADHIDEAATQQAHDMAAEFVARLVRLAHEDQVHFLVLFLSMSQAGERPATNREIGERLTEAGEKIRDSHSPQAVAKRRRALASEFPELADLLSPGRGGKR